MSGGGGSGGGQQTTTTNTVQELSPQQQQLLNLVVPTATDFINSPPEQYDGSGVVGFNPLQEQAQTQLVDKASTGGQISNTVDAGINAQNFATTGVLDLNNNPTFQQATQAAVNPILDAFTQTVLPSIRSGATAAGQSGSSRQGIAEGIAIQELFRTVGETGASFANDAYTRSLDTFDRGLLSLPNTLQAATLPETILDSVGSQQQSLEQALLNEEIQRFANDQLIPLMAAQEVASLAGVFGGGSATSTAIGPGPSSPGLASGLLGGASAGAGLASLFSVNPLIGAGLGALTAFF